MIITQRRYAPSRPYYSPNMATSITIATSFSVYTVAFGLNINNWVVVFYAPKWTDDVWLRMKMWMDGEVGQKKTINSKKLLNHRALFKKRTKNDDDVELSYTIIIEARKSGQLNLSSRGLASGMFIFIFSIR